MKINKIAVYTLVILCLITLSSCSSGGGGYLRIKKQPTEIELDVRQKEAIEKLSKARRDLDKLNEQYSKVLASKEEAMKELEELIK